MKNLYILIICFVLLILAIFFQNRAKKDKTLKYVKRTKVKRNYLIPFTILFSQARPFRRTFEKIKKRIMLLYPTNLDEIYSKVTKSMLISIGLSGVIFILFILTAGKDFFYICFGGLVSYVFCQSLIEQQYLNSHKKLIEQSYDTLSIIRHNFYMSGGKIDDAIYMSIDECPYEMSLHLDRIYKILTSVDIEKEINRYIPIAPNQFMLNLVAITSSTLKYGDKELENGNSMLLTNFDYLKDEIHVEIENIKMTKKMFAFRELICMIPVFFIKPVQWFVNSSFPEVSDFYVSMIGTLIEVLIFVAAVFSYNSVRNLKENGSKEIAEHPFLYKISKWPVISSILTNEANRDFSKAQKITDKLKLAGEHIGYKQFILQRLIYGAAFFLIFQILIIVSQWQEKNNILVDFSNSFQTSYVTDDETRMEMRETAKLYIANTSNVLDNPEKNELIQDIIKTTAVKKPLLAELMADEIIAKINKYNDVYYKWYFLCIGIGIMVIGYMAPFWMLNGKIKSIHSRMEDEVTQYQNLVMMLMYADGMSLKIMLEWMERFSYCFSESIQICINELPYDEEAAIKQMRNSEKFEPFRRFVSNMLIVNEQGLVAAFEEIVKERVHSIKTRETDMEINIAKRASKATLHCIIPLLIMVILYILYPMMSISENTMSYLGM